MLEGELFPEINPNDKKLYLFDGMGFLFRSFHAIQAPLKDAEGNPTNAIYGFTRALLKILREHTPSYLAVAMDAPGKTFREEQFPEYKANRPEPPASFVQQIPRAIRLVKSMNIPIIYKEGYEADDIIATLTMMALEEDFEVVLVSGDKDLMQIIGPRVRMFDPFRDETGRWFTEKDVEERFGTTPEHVPDALALIGDTADNIPGVPGIGEKTAKKLMEQYHSLENIYKEIDRLPPKQRKTLLDAQQQVFTCKELLTLRKDVPLEITIEELRHVPPDENLLIQELQQLSFHSLIRSLNLTGSVHKQDSLSFQYQKIQQQSELDRLVRNISSIGIFSFDLHTTTDAILPYRNIVGVAISCGKNNNYYIPFDTDPGQVSPSLPQSSIKRVVKQIFEDSDLKKQGFDLKTAILVLRNNHIEIDGIDMDVMLASYITEEYPQKHTLESISERFLKDLRLTVPNKESQTEEERSCLRAEIIHELGTTLKNRLRESAVEKLYYEIELPLVRVLADMEATGIAIDQKVFQSLHEELTYRLLRLESEIFSTAGEKFNINSPKQLQTILFEKLKLKPVRKTKTGASTDMEVLEELAVEHPLPALIIEYRTIQKLLSTYVDALPKMINPNTGRIHTTFNQATVATGRLSSSDPNLQNIPIRTEYGKRIREGFVASDSDHVFISADYSQIELRILAHLSEDPTLCEAFHRNIDIHRETASRIFDIPLEQVTEEHRRQAKTINFGVIYGMTPYGLSKSTGLTTSEADKFIKSYFERFPKVKEWIDKTITETRQRGYTTTLFNRRRYIPDINSSNQITRRSAERTAINTPVQGSAADIIKKAMIEVHSYLSSTGAKLLLQVHDELLIEAPKKNAKSIADRVKSIMENVVSLKVPLNVDIGMGRNWAEAH